MASWQISGSAPRIDGKAVLVVEDEPMVALELELVIGEAGGNVVGPAFQQSEGLALAERADVSAAILDLRLGREDAAEIANCLAKRGIPFVFHTGHGDSTLLRHWPFAPVLRKPVDPVRLIEVLARLTS